MIRIDRYKFTLVTQLIDLLYENLHKKKIKNKNVRSDLRYCLCDVNFINMSNDFILKKCRIRWEHRINWRLIDDRVILNKSNIIHLISYANIYKIVHKYYDILYKFYVAKKPDRKQKGQ